MSAPAVPLPVWEPRTSEPERLALYVLVYAERFGRRPWRLTECRAERDGEAS